MPGTFCVFNTRRSPLMVQRGCGTELLLNQLLTAVITSTESFSSDMLDHVAPLTGGAIRRKSHGPSLQACFVPAKLLRWRKPDKFDRREYCLLRKSVCVTGAPSVRNEPNSDHTLKDGMLNSVAASFQLVIDLRAGTFVWNVLSNQEEHGSGFFRIFEVRIS